MGNTDTLHPSLVSVVFPSLHLKHFRIVTSIVCHVEEAVLG